MRSIKGCMIFMDNEFKSTEKLYRAVYPPEIADMFWKLDGTVSSAAFADPKGLSVDRGDYRSDEDVMSVMRSKFTGHIISVYVKNCFDANALVLYRPSRSNPYHSEIHGSLDRAILSKSQRVHLARCAEILTPRPIN